MQINFNPQKNVHFLFLSEERMCINLFQVSGSRRVANCGDFEKGIDFFYC